MESVCLPTDVQRLSESLGELPAPVAQPVLFMVSGLPGTGKSYVSRRLAERVPLLILESDALRKVLFPRPSYSGEESARVFRGIHQLVEELLKKGVSVVLDATNLTARFREYVYRIADRLGARLMIVRVEAPPEVVLERLERRAEETGGSSDADWAVYRKLLPTVEKIRRQHFVVDTAGDVTPVLENIVREATR